MTPTTIYVRGNLAEDEIAKIQDVVNQHDLSQPVVLEAAGERFDANYVSLGVEIIGAVASAVNILLGLKKLSPKQNTANKSQDVKQNLQKKLPAAARKNVEVVQVSFLPQKSVAVTFFEQSRNRSITVTHSIKGKKDIIDISIS